MHITIGKTLNSNSRQMFQQTKITLKDYYVLLKYLYIVCDNMENMFLLECKIIHKVLLQKIYIYIYET